MSAPARPVAALAGRQHGRAALTALVALYGALEAMPEQDARAFLTGAAAAFLPGVDAGQVLDALARDRARRAARGGDAPAVRDQVCDTYKAN